MIDLKWSLVLFLLVGFIAVEANAQTSINLCDGGSCVSVNSSGMSGAEEYAIKLNRGGLFRHDPKFGGAEVIYRSSGTATESDARRWWMNSPLHRQLLLSGAIQEVRCVGGVCVGRSVDAVKRGAVASQKIANGPIKFFKRLRCR